MNDSCGDTLSNEMTNTKLPIDPPNEEKETEMKSPVVETETSNVLRHSSNKGNTDLNVITGSSIDKDNQFNDILIESNYESSAVNGDKITPIKSGIKVPNKAMTKNLNLETSFIIKGPKAIDTLPIDDNSTKECNDVNLECQKFQDCKQITNEIGLKDNQKNSEELENAEQKPNDCTKFQNKNVSENTLSEKIENSEESLPNNVYSKADHFSSKKSVLDSDIFEEAIEQLRDKEDAIHNDNSNTCIGKDENIETILVNTGNCENDRIDDVNSLDILDNNLECNTKGDFDVNLVILPNKPNNVIENEVICGVGENILETIKSGTEVDFVEPSKTCNEIDLMESDKTCSEVDAIQSDKASSKINLLQHNKACEEVDLIQPNEACNKIDIVGSNKICNDMDLIQPNEVCSEIDLMDSKKACAEIDLIESNNACNEIEFMERSKACSGIDVIESTKICSEIDYVELSKESCDIDLIKPSKGFGKTDIQQLSEADFREPNSSSTKINFMSLTETNKCLTKDDTHNTSETTSIKVDSESDIKTDLTLQSDFIEEGKLKHKTVGKWHHTNKETNATNYPENIYLADSSLSDTDTSQKPSSLVNPKFELKPCKVNLGSSYISENMLRNRKDLIVLKPNFNQLKRKLEEMLQAAQKEEEKSMRQLKKMKDEKSAMLQDIVKEIQKVKKKFKV